MDIAALFDDGIALEPQVGGEWQVFRWMALRAGVSDSDPTAGLGLKLFKFRIDYAWIHNADGDAHYDTASAYIKSMRGSDPDAALYWLAKMVVAGEDPRFIARRLVICAAEDVGNADPQALVVANAAMQVADFVGFPEAKIPLAQATIYVACAPKSNASYLAVEKAMKDIEEERTQEVPDDLKDASYFGAEKLGHGLDYKYAHLFKDHYVKQDYVRKKKKYYFPTNMGFEKRIKEWMSRLKETPKTKK